MEKLISMEERINEVKDYGLNAVALGLVAGGFPCYSTHLKEKSYGCEREFRVGGLKCNDGYICSRKNKWTGVFYNIKFTLNLKNLQLFLCNVYTISLKLKDLGIDYINDKRFEELFL